MIYKLLVVDGNLQTKLREKHWADFMKK